MDIATIIGSILGIGLIGGSMLFTSLNYGLSMQAFWNLESMMIVLGGTLSATAIAFRLNDVKNVFGLIKFVFQKPAFQLDEVVEDLVNLGEAYRKDRKSLEQAATNINNRFLKDGVAFIAQGTPLEDLRTIMETREEYRERREQNEAGLMKTLGTYSPAFGMVGTLIGLVFMLFNMGGSGGIDSIGPAMGVALITTFYGAVLANLIFNPFAEKLQARNKENSHAHQLMIHGLLMIWKKKHPLEVKDMLISYIPHEERKQFLDSNE